MDARSIATAGSIRLGRAHRQRQFSRLELDAHHPGPDGTSRGSPLVPACRGNASAATPSPLLLTSKGRFARTITILSSNKSRLSPQIARSASSSRRVLRRTACPPHIYVELCKVFSPTLTVKMCHHAQNDGALMNERHCLDHESTWISQRRSSRLTLETMPCRRRRYPT